MLHATEKGALHQAESSRRVIFCHLTALHGHVFYQIYQHRLWQLAANLRQISSFCAFGRLKSGMWLDMRVQTGWSYAIYCFFVLLKMEKSTLWYYRHNCGQCDSTRLPPVPYFQAFKILGGGSHLDATLLVTEWTSCLFCTRSLQAPTRTQQITTIYQDPGEITTRSLKTPEKSRLSLSQHKVGVNVNRIIKHWPGQWSGLKRYHLEKYLEHQRYCQKHYFLLVIRKVRRAYNNRTCTNKTTSWWPLQSLDNLVHSQVWLRPCRKFGCD